MDTLLKTPLLIVALPQLQDPNFRRSVVLIIEHNSSGAMGFIVNRPSQMPVCDLVLLKDIDIPNTIPAWFGGPVGTDNGLVLHSNSGRKEGADSFESRNFQGRFSVSSSMATLKEMVATSSFSFPAGDKEPVATVPRIPSCSLYPYRFLVGYAGWGPRQLEEEFKLGAWLQVPPSDHLLFNTPWQKMWESAIESIGIDPATFVPVQHSYLN